MVKNIILIEKDLNISRICCFWSQRDFLTVFNCSFCNNLHAFIFYLKVPLVSFIPAPPGLAPRRFLIVCFYIFLLTAVPLPASH